MATPERRPVLRICTRHLAPHVRSVIESLIALLQTGTQTIPDGAGEHASQLLFFDRIAALEAYLQGCAFPHPELVYVRGFEGFAHAFNAEHVLDRPIKPSALAAILTATQQKTLDAERRRVQMEASTRGLHLDADALMALLAEEGAQRQRILVEDPQGHRWLLDFAQRRVTGEMVDAIAQPPPHQGWSTLSAAQWSGSSTQSFSLDRWVYWLSRASHAPRLFRHADADRLQLDRAAIAAADGKDFVRLTVIFQRGASVRDASSASGLPAALVRGFLNANAVLGKLRAAPAPGPGPGLQPPVDVDLPKAMPAATANATVLRPPGPVTPSRGLFSRLLQRLFASYAH